MHDRKTILSVLIITVFVMALCAVGQTAETKTAEKKKPVIEIDNEIYAFPPTVEGTVVSHDYIVTNKGNDTLRIEGVRPSCGCTAADYTREIPPGGKGKISVKFNTNGYSNKIPEKLIAVTSNDYERPSIGLKIKGPVESFADLSKNRIAFKGKPGDNLSETITITPREKYPFKIIEATPEYGQNITAKLETEAVDNKTVYRLTVINLKKDKGGYFDKINIKTDSTVQPYIYIVVNGHFENPADIAAQPSTTAPPAIPAPSPVPVTATPPSGTPAQ